LASCKGLSLEGFLRSVTLRDSGNVVCVTVLYGLFGGEYMEWSGRSFSYCPVFGEDICYSSSRFRVCAVFYGEVVASGCSWRLLMLVDVSKCSLCPKSCFSAEFLCYKISIAFPCPVHRWTFSWSCLVLRYFLLILLNLFYRIMYNKTRLFSSHCAERCILIFD